MKKVYPLSRDIYNYNSTDELRLLDDEDNCSDTQTALVQIYWATMNVIERTPLLSIQKLLMNFVNTHNGYN